MRIYPAIVLATALVACDDNASPAPARTLEIISGEGQIAGAGTLLTQPIVVRLSTDNGRPVTGAPVHWRVIEGGGSVSPVETLTQSDGRASVQWRLGNDLGRQTLLASTGNATLTIRATSTFQIVEVAAGFRHTCALTSNGVAYCWGENAQGQLGNGTQIPSSTPVRVSGDERFKQLAAGWSHTCALSHIGQAYCWGDNSVGQSGLASSAPRSAVPAPVASADAFVAITVGFIHTCALTASGDAVCWGANTQGQLGAGVGGSVRTSGLQLAVISAGEFHTCAVRSNNAGLCWGWNSSGELGTGSPPGAIINTPTPVAGSVQFTRVAAGVRHTCSIATSGRAYCWGRNGVGETGQPPLQTVVVPAEVPGSETFTSIGTGNTHTCGLSNQRVLCWGSSPANGLAAATNTPAPINSALQFTSLGVGFDHVCGVANGEVWCWGSNGGGQLGQSGMAESIAPVRVPLPPG